MSYLFGFAMYWLISFYPSYVIVRVIMSSGRLWAEPFKNNHTLTVTTSIAMAPLVPPLLLAAALKILLNKLKNTKQNWYK